MKRVLFSAISPKRRLILIVVSFDLPLDPLQSLYHTPKLISANYAFTGMTKSRGNQKVHDRSSECVRLRSKRYMLQREFFSYERSWRAQELLKKCLLTRKKTQLHVRMPGGRSGCLAFHRRQRRPTPSHPRQLKTTKTGLRKLG